MSQFEVRDDKYKDSFQSRKTFKHNSGDLIKLFPFSTDSKASDKSEVDLVTFYGVTGEFYRACLNIAFSRKPSKDDLVASIVSSVETDDISFLIDIISKLIYTEENDLSLFNVDVLPHLCFSSPNVKLDKLHRFICSLLIDNTTKTIVKANNNHRSVNILYNLVVSELNKLSNSTARGGESDRYYQGNLVKKIRAMFNSDLNNLSGLDEFYLKNVSSLIKYYYFLYISQLSFHLERMFDYKSDFYPVYFTLEWEKLSRSRMAVDHGWLKLKSSLIPIFAHSNTLEMLNTINFDRVPVSINYPFTYEDIFGAVMVMSIEQQNLFAYSVSNLINKYKENFAEVNWTVFEDKFLLPANAIYTSFHCFSLIYRLYSMIKFQFEYPNFKSAYVSYSSWFKSFVDLNYIKLRGSLGPSLKIDREHLLMFTELSILSTGKDKILVNVLWGELEKRGLWFDDRSKHEIILFFEKNNSLEKKSDSGDAQYIKRLFNK